MGGIERHGSTAGQTLNSPRKRTHRREPGENLSSSQVLKINISSTQELKEKTEEASSKLYGISDLL